MNYPTSSYSIPLRKIAQGLDKVKWRGDRDFSACCPAHDDKNPSFHARDVDGKILVKCFAGCTQGEVISALRDRGLWSARSYHQKAIEKRKANETALRCGLNGSTQHPYKTAPLGFRSRGSYKAVQRAGAATDSGERAGSPKNRVAPETVV